MDERQFFIVCREVEEMNSIRNIISIVCVGSVHENLK